MRKLRIAIPIGGICALIFAVAGCVSGTHPEMAGLMLAKGGGSDFRIVLADDAPPATRTAAEELQRFLGEITGADFPIASASGPIGAHEIILGSNAHLDRLGLEIDIAGLGPEGYEIRTVGPHLVIVGGEPRGTLYGIYGLLEEHLGCRWFTPTVSRIPKQERLVLPALDERKIPVFEYREPFVMDCFDGDWCARNRVNSSASSLEERHGGKIRFGEGMFCHTFRRLVPPEIYFDEHPEYFSEIDGRRVKEDSQLCCTNEEVIQICIEEVRKRMRADPGGFVFSVSQNDWDNHCECAKCQALAAREGSQAAPVLQLVNRVAEAVEDEFPDKVIETLAYTWTRTPPKTIRPRPNVVVRLCSIECCFVHPLLTCDSEKNRRFVSDLKGWSQICNRLWIWDYVTNFREHFLPYPNLQVRDDNLRLFAAHNVKGVFEQDTYQTINGEMSALSGYLGAKLLWNPESDADVAINEFLDAVYGPAAEPIRAYIDLLHNEAVEGNHHAGCYSSVTSAGYISAEILRKCHALWDDAERAVADDPGRLERVRIDRLPVEFAELEFERLAGRGGYIVDHEAFETRMDPDYVAKAKHFFEVARRANITRMWEGKPSLNEYEAILKEATADPGRTYPSLAPVVRAGASGGLSYECYEGWWEDLPDFDTMTPVKSGASDHFGVDVTDHEENFGLRFSGCVEVPRDGLYRFYVKSNDGSRLFIGDTLVVDNGGMHTLMEKGGYVGLRRGTHPIRVDYFQEGGSWGLEASFEGPGIEKHTITPADLGL